MKFNIYDYISHDETKYFMNGVFYEDKGATATDGRELVHLTQQEYDPKFEGKIISKELLPIDGTFPNWRRVVPDNENLAEVYPMDWEKLTKDFKELDWLFKMHRKLCGRKYTIRWKLGEHWFNIDHIKLACEFASEYPESDFRPGVSYGKCAKVEDKYTGSFFIFMPMQKLDSIGKHFTVGNFYFLDVLECESVEDILRRYKKLDILQRKEFGTLTDKDNKFLEQINKYLSYERKIEEEYNG